jgi:hypothetical protein
MVKVDSAGQEEWTLNPSTNDSFNINTLRLAALPDGNLIAFWVHDSWKPNKVPGGIDFYEQYEYTTI